MKIKTTRMWIRRADGAVEPIRYVADWTEEGVEILKFIDAVHLNDGDEVLREVEGEIEE